MFAHVRSFKPSYTTIPEHMPANHRFVASWSPERFSRWAEKIGPQTREWVEGVLASKVDPEQAYRTCLVVIRLPDRNGAARLEAACARGTCYGVRSYKDIKSILDKGLDRVAPDAPEPRPATAHRRLRGGTYYK